MHLVAGAGQGVERGLGAVDPVLAVADVVDLLGG